MKTLAVALVRLLLGSSAYAQSVGTPHNPADVTYDAVRAGMKCQQNSIGNMECDYRVGRSLHFAIAGVGKADAAIHFYSSSVEDDYYAVVNLAHGCVIVRPGKARQEEGLDMAFVSPQNGKVYSFWKTYPTSEACQEGY